jgi:hypothetical protein
MVGLFVIFVGFSLQGKAKAQGKGSEGLENLSYW